MGGLAALVFGWCRYSNSGAPGYLVVGRPVGFMAAALRRPAGGRAGCFPGVEVDVARHSVSEC